MPDRVTDSELAAAADTSPLIAAITDELLEARRLLAADGPPTADGTPFWKKPRHEAYRHMPKWQAVEQLIGRVHLAEQALHLQERRTAEAHLLADEKVRIAASTYGAGIRLMSLVDGARRRGRKVLKIDELLAAMEEPDA